MNHNFKSRSTIIFLLFNLLYIIIAINAYIIQIQHHDFYTKLAEQQYHVTITQRPPRGTIIDRTGNNYLAMNCNHVSAFILPNQMIHQTKTMHLLQEQFPKAYERLIANKNHHFMFVKRRLSPGEQKIINSHSPHDICFLSEPGRYYPVPSASPVIGLTSIDNKGVAGIELVYENLLAGNPTICHLEKDARSGYYYFKKKTSNDGEQEKSIQLSIDADLQFLIANDLRATVEKFNAQQAAAIIINPRNGEILSMALYPYFNPHKKQNNSIDLCKNTIVTDAYELGSVIKVCAALAALEEKVVTPDELIDCKNTTTTYIDGRKINTVTANGTIPFYDVIALSNNIGIAIVAKRLDKKLYDHCKRLGFGAKTGIKFPGENPGFVNPPEKWSKQSIISLSYGYEISATLLQLACAFCTVATGYHVTPTLLMNQIPTEEKTRLYSPENIAIIKNILEQTTLHGTAKKAKIKGYRVMSKTGTANMLINGKYSNNNNLYTCAGIIEKDDYERVIVTFIKETNQKNVYAATVAVPLFEQVAERMLIHDKIIS